MKWSEGILPSLQKVAGSRPVRPTTTDKNVGMNQDCTECGDKRMPSEVVDVEKFITISGHAEYCAVKRLKDVVKLKLRTPSTLYTLKVEPMKAEEVIKKLQCEIREI
jgi:ferritin-like protein